MNKIYLFSIVLLLFISCNTYGEKTESGFVEVYYEHASVENKATEIAKYLDENKFSEDHITSFKLTKDSLYNVAMVVKKDFDKDEKNDAIFMSIGYLLSMEVFNNEPINFILSDPTFKPLKTIPINKTSNN